MLLSSFKDYFKSNKSPHQEQTSSNENSVTNDTLQAKNQFIHQIKGLMAQNYIATFMTQVKNRNEHDFAFAGLLTCGECGSSITAEIKKEKYIYYHCAHGKGDCSQTKYIRQEALSEQFEEAVKKISLNHEQKTWVIEALKQSNFDEQEYHTDKIKQLNAECQKWRDRINQIYMDKLDGKITEEFWQEKHNAWTQELRGMQKIIEAYDKANEGYMETGIHFLELSNRAYSLYSAQNSQEKAKLLKILLSNCKLIDGIAHWEYQKPFDILAKNDGCTVNWS